MAKQTFQQGDDNIIVRNQAIYGQVPQDVIDRLGNTALQLLTDDQTALGAINELKSNLTDLTEPITASFIAGTYGSNHLKISTNLVLPVGKYEITITLPYCNQALDKLYGLTDGTNTVPQSYSVFLMGATKQFILEVTTPTTYYVETSSSGLSITISNVDRGQIYAKKLS